MKKKEENRKSAAEAAQQATEAALLEAQRAWYELDAFEEKYGEIIDRHNELVAKCGRLCQEEHKAYKRWIRLTQKPIETIAKK